VENRCIVARLVLGCGSIGQRVVERLEAAARPRERDGLAVREDVLVLTRDETLAETFREEGIDARYVESITPETLAELETPDLLFVAGETPAENRQAVEAARRVFPDQHLVAYIGDRIDETPAEEASTRADRVRIEQLATTVIDSVPELGSWLLERTASEAARKAIRLRVQLRSIDGRLAVVMHDNPDPDAIASAVALTKVAESVGVEADACYYGEISHQENRAMVNLLDLELTQLEETDSLGRYDAFALIDHSRPGINDQLPPDIHVDIIIDHHPPRGPVQGAFVDLREQIGATSTLITGYLEYFGLEPDPQVATALLYGIRVDTKEFTREVSSLDFDAAATLWPVADDSLLRQIEQPTIDGDTYDTIARAIKNRTRRGSVVVASVGEMTDRDALPQAADQLLTMDGVDTTLVFGFHEQMVFLSARARGSAIDVGETIRDAYEQIGSAGGHADMAGAQLQMGVLAESEDDDERDSILSVVEEVLTDRFFEAVDTQTGTPVGVYDQTSEMLFDADADS